METRAIQLRAHQKNIDRYRGLLKTKLNETERLFLEKRVSEETIGMLKLMEQAISALTPPARSIGAGGDGTVDFLPGVKWPKSVAWDVNGDDQARVRSCPLYSSGFTASTAVPASPKCESSL